MTTPGERFKKIRLQLNLSQEQLGIKLGLTNQGISNIEKNKSFLNLEKLQKLSDMNVNLNYLISGLGSPFLNSEEITDELEQKIVAVMKKYGVLK